MKAELPGWAIPVVVVIGLGIIGGIWFLSGSGGGMSAEDAKRIEMQSEVQRQMGEAYGRGQSNPNAAPSVPGQAAPPSGPTSAEAAARAASSGDRKSVV